MSHIDMYEALNYIDPGLIEDAEIIPESKIVPFQRIRYAVAAVACLALVLMGSYQMVVPVTASIYITMNPRVSYDINRAGKVTNLHAMNEEGSLLLENYESAGKTRVKVAEELIKRAEELGMIKENDSVTIAIAAKNSNLSQKYSDEFNNKVAEEFGGAQRLSVDVKNLLSVKEIKSIALKYFGLAEAEFTQIDCDTQQGMTYYDITMENNGVVYSCEIDGESGEVLSSNVIKDSQKGNLTLSEEMSKQEAVTEDTSSDEVQQENQVKNDNELTDNVVGSDNKQDSTQAEVSEGSNSNAQKPVEDQKSEAELSGSEEDDLSNNSNLEESVGKVNETVGETEQKEKIGKKTAKELALSQAGLSSANFISVKLVTIKDVKYYKLKYDTDDIQYYCVVDAYTGEVVKYESKKKELEKDGNASEQGKWEAYEAVLGNSLISESEQSEDSQEENQEEEAFDLKGIEQP